MVKVTLPEMGESVTEGSIVEWRKRVGDFVAEGDALVDVTTDKVDVEVPATASGVITQILAGEGDTVSVGAVLAEIDTSKSNGRRPHAGHGCVRKRQRTRRAAPRAGAGPRRPRRDARRPARPPDGPAPRRRPRARARVGPERPHLARRRRRSSRQREAAPRRRGRRRPDTRRRDVDAAEGSGGRAGRLHGAEPHDSDGDEFSRAAASTCSTRGATNSTARSRPPGAARRSRSRT